MLSNSTTEVPSPDGPLLLDDSMTLPPERATVAITSAITVVPALFRSCPTTVAALKVVRVNVIFILYQVPGVRLVNASAASVAPRTIGDRDWLCCNINEGPPMGSVGNVMTD